MARKRNAPARAKKSPSYQEEVKSALLIEDSGSLQRLRPTVLPQVVLRHSLERIRIAAAHQLMTTPEGRELAVSIARLSKEEVIKDALKPPTYVPIEYGHGQIHGPEQRPIGGRPYGTS